MPASYSLRPSLVIKTFHDRGVEYIVVGGLSAVILGAPIVTNDMDIVHRRTPENVERLIDALSDLKAGYRDLTDRHLPPKPDLLLSASHNLFRTIAGPLDCLCTIGDQRGYDELLPHTLLVDVDGFIIRVLDLAELIAIKEAVGRQKDRVVLEVLRHTLRMRTKTGGKEPG